VSLSLLYFYERKHYYCWPPIEEAKDLKWSNELKKLQQF